MTCAYSEMKSYNENFFEEGPSPEAEENQKRDIRSELALAFTKVFFFFDTVAAGATHNDLRLF